MKQIEILDSTLRDGMQGEGITFSIEDKLHVVQALDEIGMGLIEAGNPGSNPKDLEFFRRMQGQPLLRAKLCAFGSTRRKNIRVEEDANVQSLLLAQTPVVTIFGKAWDMHVTEVLGTTLEENLAMISDTVRFFVEQGKRVVFDAEHFFDGFAAHEQYALKALQAAADSGADTLCLCDTNGATFPSDIGRIVQCVANLFSEVKIGIHCHNDTGMAVAQSIAAVEAGALQVQGTFAGFGERCGNANLCTIIANLQLKSQYHCIDGEKIVKLTETARRICELANVGLPNATPYVGASAFTHKGGMHADGVAKIPRSFEHIQPETVGNSRRILASEIAGKSALLKKIRRVDERVQPKDPVVDSILQKIKELEFAGYQFEAAEQSFELLVRREMGKLRKFFELEYYKIIGEQPLQGALYPSSAIIKVKVGEETRITGAEGDGPVHALDLALREALQTFYPCLAHVRLTDYRVRVLESSATTAAKVRVLIESTDGKHTWNTVGVSTDIIEASFLALTDSIVYKLTLEESQPVAQH